MKRPIDYATVLTPVFEVTLIGRARRAAWQTFLGEEDLTLERDIGGMVEISLSAIEAREKGLTFRELSFTLRLDEDQIFMAHAYNSRRPLAFVKRTFLRMPYYPAQITVEARYIALNDGDSQFSATLQPSATDVREEDEFEEWMIRLPRELRKKAASAHFVQARLAGATTHYATAGIELTYQAKPGSVWDLLEASDWQVNDWLVRTAATHSRSKTYNRRDRRS
jgi:hypothetical protein